jgi:hypothetical protein
MRLAQAARKLSITTEDIVDFLEIRGITIEKESNTKLGEEAVQMLYKYFEIEEESKLDADSVIEVEDESKSKAEESAEKVESENSEIEENTVEDITSEEIEVKETVEEEGDQISEEENTEEPKKKSFRTVDELLQGEEDLGEDFVIKPAKVELKGLNVVGKIDLPEQSPKQEQKEERNVRQPKKVVPHSVANKSSRRRQNRELSPTEIRRRAEQKEAREREQTEREKKKKREQFYKEKILKPKQIEQKSRPSKKKSTVEGTAPERKSRPTTVLGKFWRWLNT